MKSQLFVVRLSAAAFLLGTGLTQVFAQRILDVAAGDPWPYARPWLQKSLGKSPAAACCTMAATLDGQRPPVAHLDWPLSLGVPAMRAMVEYAPGSGIHGFAYGHGDIGHSTARRHAAEAFAYGSGQGLGPFASGFPPTARLAEPEPPRQRSLHRIKLVLMVSALALLVLGVGHKTVPRW